MQLHRADLTLSVVIPAFNEEDALPLMAERLRPVLDAMSDPGGEPFTYEVVVVDDGSRDATAVVLERLRRTWAQLRVVRLRTNAGHQAALTAGLTRARGRWVATLDADLQDPPELLPELFAAGRSGDVDVVYAVRNDRTSDSAFKRATARAFYRTARRLVGSHIRSDAGDYRLMSRATVDAVVSLPERHQVLRFVVPALGFPSAEVAYRREARVAGRTKYPLTRMIRLSVDAFTGSSIAPLRFATWFGLVGAAVTGLLLLYALAAWATGRAVAGWTSTFVAVASVGAVQLLCLGTLGEYVGRMYTQMQGRPAYFVAWDSASEPATSDERFVDSGGGSPRSTAST